MWRRGTTSFASSTYFTGGRTTALSSTRALSPFFIPAYSATTVAPSVVSSSYVRYLSASAPVRGGGPEVSAPSAASSGPVVGLALLAFGALGGWYGYNQMFGDGGVSSATDPASQLPTADAPKKLNDDAPSALNPNEFVKFKLSKAIPVSHDSKIYRFELPSPQHKLGLPVASCLVTKAPGPEGKDIVRPYTPITSDADTRGHFDLLVKVYEQGNMSKHIDNLKPGDSLEFKGPIAKLPYTANMKKDVAMIAGGTGITPMYQVLRAILDNPDDKTNVSLIFCNKSEADILLKPTLDALAKKHKNFKVHYLVDKADSTSFKGDVGYINKDIIQQHIAGPSDSTLVLVCGPPGFYNVVSGGKTPDYKQGEVKGFLKDLGYNESMVFKF